MSGGGDSCDEAGPCRGGEEQRGDPWDEVLWGSSMRICGELGVEIKLNKVRSRLIKHKENEHIQRISFKVIVVM